MAIVRFYGSSCKTDRLIKKQVIIYKNRFDMANLGGIIEMTKTVRRGRSELIKTILIDDEKMALEQLRYVLGQYEEIKIEAVFTEPAGAIRQAGSIKPEAVFVDLQMPEINGFTVAERILSEFPGIQIVFVTGFVEYVSEFKSMSAKYILKPITKKRADKAICSVISEVKQKLGRK